LRDGDGLTDLWKQIIEIIENRKRFILATHVNADGDGLGAQLALYYFLRQRGKDVRILNSDRPPDNLSFLAPEDVVQIYDSGRHSEVLHDAEVIILLDNSSAHRLGRLQEPIQKSPAMKVCIDHHPHPDTIWDVMVIDEKASATGEMIYWMMQKIGPSIPPEAAEPLYVAIVTDTGNFRFSNTKPEILRIAADLLDLGVNVPKVYQELYERNSPGYTRLLGAALADLHLEREGRLGYLVVTREMMNRCGAEDEDTGEIINNLLTIDGARVAILFKEIDSGRTKVSLRSKGEIDVNRVAAMFGGGGHRNASGIVVNVSLGEAMEKVLAEIRRIV
jgi:phosphoesterase RecJ-like protein